MSNSIYITGMGSGSGKSVVVLGVMELLARHGRKLSFFRPVVEADPLSDHLIALVASRYDIAARPEIMFGVTNTSARDLISTNKEDELHSRIMEKFRGLAQDSDFVVCAGTDYQTMHTALEFEFNLEVARNLGAPLMPIVAGQGRTVGRIVDAIVFTGGIGENASVVRDQACQGLEHLGVAVDPAKNEAARGSIAEVQKDGAPVKVLVIRTDEEREIARQTIHAIEKEQPHGNYH